MEPKRRTEDKTGREEQMLGVSECLQYKRSVRSFIDVSGGLVPSVPSSSRVPFLSRLKEKTLLRQMGEI